MRVKGSSQSSEERTYRSPRLVSYGSLNDLTRDDGNYPFTDMIYAGSTDLGERPGGSSEGGK